MADPLLRMRGIGKRFPGVVALDQVDFEIAAGEVVALIGENGAGKSTLMKILGGVYQPDSGQLQIDGASVQINSVTDADSNGIGFVHQELNNLDNLDVAGNIFLGREPLYGGPMRLIDDRKLRELTQPYLDMLGLDIDPATPLANLSLGQQQLVEIAKALSKDARIIIMDEPTSSLTLTETECLLEVVRQLKEQWIAVIYISHRLGEVTTCADRVAVLRDGSNAGGLAKDEIDHDRMVSLMVGRELSEFYELSVRDKRPDYFKVTSLVTTAYPDKKLTFDIAAGEILGFAGLVGAGRSEMAQALFGVDKSLGGSMKLDGQTVPLNSAKSAIANGIFLAPEDRKKTGIILEFAIRSNISLADIGTYAKAGLINTQREASVAEKQMADMSIKAPSIESQAGNLSGGNQQKVVLGKWLSMGPKVMILDEPTRGIDVGAKREIYKLMDQLAQRGVAIIMISSDMEEVIGVSDRIAVVHEGSITGFLDKPNFSEENVMQLAVGRKLSAA